MIKKTFVKTIKFDSELIKRIEKYQKDNYLNSFSQAVIVLVQKGLESVNNG